MRAGIRGFARVVQQQREIKNEWPFERLENVVILIQRRFRSAPDAVQLFDAAQGVLVGSILMIELVLNQTSKLAEFGQILPKQADFVHRAKNARHAAALVEDLQKRFACMFVFEKTPSNQSQFAA